MLQVIWQIYFALNLLYLHCNLKKIFFFFNRIVAYALDHCILNYLQKNLIVKN